MLRGVLIALAVLVGSWAVLAVLAARLPPGLLRDLVGFLPDCVTLLRRLRRDSRVPLAAKVALALAALWVVSPIDLIPEFLPVIGPLDDVLVVALALRYAGRRVPREVLLEAWPGDPRFSRGFSAPHGASPNEPSVHRDVPCWIHGHEPRQRVAGSIPPRLTRFRRTPPPITSPHHYRRRPSLRPPSSSLRGHFGDTTPA